MAGNPSYNQFGMNQRNFQDIVPTSQYDGQILSSLASLTNCIRTPSVPVMNNLLNAPGQRPPQQTYVNPIGNQQSNQWTASTDNASLMLLVTAACQERFKQPNTYDCRVKLQKLLLSKSYEPFLIQYLRSGFLTDFCSMASFDIIQNLTNVDMSKAKTVVKGIVDRMSSAQYYQPQVPGNQFSQDNSSNQNFGVQSNYDQFQVQGSNSSRNHDAIRHFNQVPRDNVSYPQLSPQQQQLQQQEFRQQELRQQQQQQQQQRMVQRGNVPNVTQNTQPLQQTNQSTSGHRWYAMPKETYQAGRVVQEKNNTMPSQGTVPLSHYNEPVPRSSSAHSEISPGIISNQGAQRISPPLSQINPRTVAQFSNGRMDSGGQNPPEIQPRPKSAETISSADRKRNHSSPAPYIQQEKTVETVPSPNCPNNAKKQSSPAESKKLVRQQIEQLMQSSEKNMPKVAETNPKAVSQVQQPVSEGRLSGTPTLPVEQTAETISSEPSEDITDLFSMPVLSEDITDPKEGANRLPSRKDVTAHFDDMNVLSPYTADVVSNSLDSWLSGSKHSAILDRVGSKTSKGRQLTKPERPSVSPGSVERTAREEESNPSRRKEDPPQSETSDLAEYDPPLPVIKHKKREDRISPNKKSPEGENKPEYSKDSKAVREKQVSENRKSLFSVISDFMTENNSKGNGACERKSLESQDSMSGESMSAHQKTRHKSSEVSSSSTLPRHEKIFTNVETHHSENHKPDSGKSVEHSKAIIEQSCKEKIVSDWKKNHIEKESNLSKCHNRRKSCNDQELPRERLNRDRRTLTWDGSSVAAKLPCTEIENTSQKPVPLNGKLVDFNGHIILQISILDGTYLLMQELLATCFKGHDPNSVYKAKTSALGVNNITLTHNCRKDVIKYLDYLKISYPSQLSIVSMSNAHRLFDYLEESKDTEKTAAEAMDSGVNDKEPSSDSNKNRSASPDSTENACKKPVPEESMDTSMVEGDQDDLQQNKVSSQSLNDLEDPNVSDLSHISALEDNDDAASTVSDATDIYCEGKPIASLGGDGSGEGSSEFRLPLGLDGGLAVVEKENSPDTYLRFVTVRGNKCFLYKDLFKLFGKGQVVNIVVNNYMKVKTCTSEEAEFFNRNQPGMSLVDPADDSLLHEKYVRKLFLFFGETFPKQKRAIDVILTNENPSSKRSRECDDCEPPSKKMRHPSGSVESYSDQNDGSSDKMDDETMKMFHLLKGQHMEMAAELAQLKTKLKQAEESNISLEKKYKLYSNNLIGVKADFEDVQKKNTLLEENFKAQEETLAQMKEELKGKDEVIATLTRERDHFKNFVERITDTYQDVAD